MTEAKFTPGPWVACNMVHEEGRPMTPEELGEYVCNAVKKSNETRFLFVSGNNGDGNVDVCHVGNGPKGPANAHLIAAAPDMYEALANLENDDGLCMPESAWNLVLDALEKARGKTNAG